MPEYTIVRDTREKTHALTFPTHIEIPSPRGSPRSLGVQRIRLRVADERLSSHHPELHKADYYLRGFPNRVVYEAKYGLEEIGRNILNRRRRALFGEELDYLAARCRNAILLIRGRASDYLKPTTHVPHPGVVLHQLWLMILERNLSLHFDNYHTPQQRRACGAWVAHALVAGAYLPSTLFTEYAAWNPSDAGSTARKSTSSASPKS